MGLSVKTVAPATNGAARTPALKSRTPHISRVDCTGPLGLND